jgi:hypothetical protein
MLRVVQPYVVRVINGVWYRMPNPEFNPHVQLKKL